MKDLDYYRRLSYTLRTELIRDSDGSDYWVAEYLELRGCKTDGESEAEAVANLQELFDEYISARMEVSTKDIPEPAGLPIFETYPLSFKVEYVQPPAGDSDMEFTDDTRGEMTPQTVSKEYDEIAT